MVDLSWLYLVSVDLSYHVDCRPIFCRVSTVILCWVSHSSCTTLPFIRCYISIRDCMHMKNLFVIVEYDFLFVIVECDFLSHACGMWFFYSLEWDTISRMWFSVCDCLVFPRITSFSYLGWMHRSVSSRLSFGIIFVC